MHSFTCSNNKLSISELAHMNSINILSVFRVMSFHWLSFPKKCFLHSGKRHHWQNSCGCKATLEDDSLTVASSVLILQTKTRAGNHANTIESKNKRSSKELWQTQECYCISSSMLHKLVLYGLDFPCEEAKNPASSWAFWGGNTLFNNVCMWESTRTCVCCGSMNYYFT